MTCLASVSVLYGPRGIFGTIEQCNVNIYITERKYLHFKRAYGHRGKHISQIS